MSHKWGLVVDLDRCTGCEACVVACHAENNIPTAGEDQAARGRTMQWIRVERYWEGDFPNPRIRFQPVLCQQCDDAPCEPVCPTYASYHTPEGLNAQVYNRCIGTRFCANACPYTVRSFNFFNPKWEMPLNLQLNPDVSVRSVGIMEKCTFCVQRIKSAEIQAEAEKRELKDGEFTTACAQSCASKALVFGDLNDPNSEVSRLASSQSRHQTIGRTRHQAQRDLSGARHLARCKERLNKSSRICCGRSSTAARSTRSPWRSSCLVLAGVAAFGYQLWAGIGVWGINSPVFWASISPISSSGSASATPAR
jgi:Fe-S-cluster-containing dehydrogenase component